MRKRSNLKAPFMQVREAVVRLVLGVGLVSPILGTSPGLADEKIAIEVDEQSLAQEKIEKLIEELGAPSYSQRLRAKKELEAFGLLAFDALHAAQTHPNSEISFSSRFLLGNLKIHWATDSDTPQVREILAIYGSLDQEDRRTRMQFLADLPFEEAFPPLLRLARFENDQRLSREAAIQILLHEESVKIKDPGKCAALIRQTLGSNQRPSSEWLRTFAEELETHRIEIAKWRELIQQEQQRYLEGTSRETDPNTVFRLCQATADRAELRGDHEAALGMAHEAIEIIPDRMQNVLEAVQWVSRRGYWDCVKRLAAKHDSLFSRFADLMYYHADALEQLNEPAAAKALLSKVLELSPIKDISDMEEITPLDEVTLLAVDEHFRQGEMLQNQGKYDWAENEFRYVLNRVPVWVVKSVEVRFRLTLLLQDQLRYADAVEILQPLVDRIQKDATFKLSMGRDRFFMQPEDYVKHLAYFKGMAIAESNPDEARKYFLQVFQNQGQVRDEFVADSIEVDVLIAMYKLSGDDKWQADVRQRLQHTLSQLDQKIREWEKSEKAKEVLSSYCNHYAWLVGNTEGNVDLAVRRAKQAMEHQNDSAAVIDTLARVTFKKGEIAEAIRLQRKALALEPHSLTMQRQLEEFQAAVPKS